MKFATKPRWHYPPHLRHVATLPWEIKTQIFCWYWRKSKQIAFLITSTFVIHPQILIFSVLKITNPSPYWLQIKFSMSLFFLWPPYEIGGIIFLPCGYYLSFFLSIFFSSPNLSGRRLDVYHTATYGVALVRISNACLKCAARGSLQIQDAKKSPKIAIWAPSHNFVGLYLRK